MVNNQKLLEGDVVNPEFDDSEIERLRGELRRISSEKESLRIENVRLRQRVNQIDGPAAHLRQTLQPLYQAMQAMFGDLELIDPMPMASTAGAPSEPVSSPRVDDRKKAVWDSWKSKLGGGCAKVIDALMTHEDLNTQQLAITTGLHRTTIPGLIHKLNKAGLLNKNGGRFSLKSL